jgi:hypothetical protein
MCENGIEFELPAVQQGKQMQELSESKRKLVHELPVSIMP